MKTIVLSRYCTCFAKHRYTTKLVLPCIEDFFPDNLLQNPFERISYREHNCRSCFVSGLSTMAFWLEASSTLFSNIFHGFLDFSLMKLFYQCSWWHCENYIVSPFWFGSWLPYSTYRYLEFHLLTKLKEHSREICYLFGLVVEAEFRLAFYVCKYHIWCWHFPTTQWIHLVINKMFHVQNNTEHKPNFECK